MASLRSLWIYDGCSLMWGWSDRLWWSGLVCVYVMGGRAVHSMVRVE